MQNLQNRFDAANPERQGNPSVPETPLIILECGPNLDKRKRVYSGIFAYAIQDWAQIKHLFPLAGESFFASSNPHVPQQRTVLLLQMIRAKTHFQER